MSLWKIAWRSMQQRALASWLTAVSMGLGVALVVAVLVIQTVIDRSFQRRGEGYDLIVGPKGNGLQLVLNSVYFLSDPVGTIPGDYYREFTEGQFALDVEAAIPICMGDSFRGFRVVGTTPQMFEKLTYYGGQPYQFALGRNFDDAKPFEAVVGATAARETRLKPGDRFKTGHGTGEATKEHAVEFTVVGVLAQTGTPQDRAVFVNRRGFYQTHSHGDEAGSHAAAEHAVAISPESTHRDEKAGERTGEHADEKAGEHASEGDAEGPVSAILVCVDPTKPGMEQILQRQIGDGTVAQAVMPAKVIAELFQGIIGDIQWILLIMAVLIVVVAGLGIMVSIYNSMSDRRHEIAIMRALGASRMTVMRVILMESILLSLGGGVLGLLLGHGLIGALAPTIVQQTGVAVSLLHFQTIELLLIPGLIVLASAVGYLPALTAYRTDVARSLTSTP